DAGKPDRAAFLVLYPHLRAELERAFAEEDKADAQLGPLRVPRPAVGGALPRLLGDYELLEEVARGGVGVVYKARQVSLNRTVAVKLILAGQLASEADALLSLASPERLGRYRIEGEIARGGMGKVLRVFDEVFERPLAMKVLLTGGAVD